ncbi:MAG: TetR/AcrR family transcriptional regulator [Polyangiaceae bacterium]
MPQKMLTTARKKPAQERSKATVDAILDATARVLRKDGYDRASTNRIAETAGVSIGSLYQYFPSKEALTAALIDRHRAEVMEIFYERMREIGELPMREAIRTIVRAMVDVHGVDPALHRVLSEQVPKVGRLGALLEDVEVNAASVAKVFLESRRAELRVRDIDAAVFVVVHAVEAVTHRGARYYQSRFAPDVMVDEVTDLVHRYLVK